MLLINLHGKPNKKNHANSNANAQYCATLPQSSHRSEGYRDVKLSLKFYILISQASQSVRGPGGSCVARGMTFPAFQVPLGVVTGH